MNYNLLSNLFQLIPDVKGKRRIARRFLNKHEIINPVIFGKNNTAFKLPNIRESIGFELFINGIYEAPHIKFINRYLKNAKVFLDIGANIGAISIPLAKLNPGVKVYSIEASPKVFGYLLENIRLNNLLNIDYYNLAITDSVQRKIPFYSPDDQFGKGSLSAIFTKTAELVDSMTLDIFVAEKNIERIDIIKLDVEGYEYQALKGGEKTLTSNKAPKVILMEFVDWTEDLANNERGASQKLLLEYGYKLFDFSKFKKGNKFELAAPVWQNSCIILATR